VLPGATPPRMTLRIAVGMLLGMVLSAAIGGVVGGLLTHVLPNGVALIIGIAIVIAGFVLSYRWGRVKLLEGTRGPR